MVGGFAWVGAASAVAGVAGYAITIVAARLLGDEYGLFGVFWSALYFGVGALAGAQQAFAGMARFAPDDENTRPRVCSALLPSLCASLLLALIAAGTLVPVVLERNMGFGAALVVGLASFGVYAVALGGLYGAKRWGVVAAVTVLDPVLRLAFIAVVGMAGGGVAGAVWAAVLPAPILAVALVLVMTRERSLVLDRSVARAMRSAGVIVAGGVAASFVINGIPVVFAVLSPDGVDEAGGQYVFAFILIRAPLVVTLLAFQSYLVVLFRDSERRGAALALTVLGLALVGLLFTVALWRIGEPVVAFVSGPLGTVSADVLAGIGLAATTTAILVATGAWVISVGASQRYALGWWATALAFVVAVAVTPGDPAARITAASILAPVVGIAVHLRPGARSTPPRG